MARARGANAVMAMAMETSYGTPPVSGYKKLPFVSSQLGAEQGLLESDLLGQGRSPADPTYDVVTNDGDVVVPIDSRAFGTWLRLLLGPPQTTTQGGGYSHYFASGAAGLPSASIEIGHPDIPLFTTHYGVRANTFSIQMQRSGLTSATFGLIAKGETVAAATSSAGTPDAYAAIQRFAAASGSVALDGATIGEVVSANLSFSNALEKIETLRGDGEIAGADPGMPTASLALTLKFADATLLNKATGKVPVSVALSWSIASGVSLQIVLPRLFIPRPKRPITGPAGIQVEVNTMGSSTTSPLMVLSLNNDVASYA